jgi:single-stranded-DNA-specific exonuclease
MKNYIMKKLSEYENIGFLGKVHSALFAENGFTTMKEISQNFPDFRSKKNWLSKFLTQDLTSITGQQEFRNFVEGNKDKHFCIIGDYDADGIMATTIMKLTFDKLGIQCSYLIPDRLNDGYAIKDQHVTQAIELGAQVIVTVDNGITQPEVIDYAKSKGISVILTDHHLPDPNGALPKADILVNPHVYNDPFKFICGSFVALKLVLPFFDIVNSKTDDYLLRELALFAAVATITDVMPLVQENRLLVKYVLDSINFVRDKNMWTGRTMKFLNGFADGSMLKDMDRILTEDTFGYYIGPTLNASGRVNGETSQIVTDIVKSADYSTFINGYYAINKERQYKTKKLLEEYSKEEFPIIFTVLDASKFDFPVQGLIGLVASRVSDEEQKPAFIGVQKEDGTISFSCRSNPGYSLHDAFNRMVDSGQFNISGGGHDGAMGIHLNDPSQLWELKEAFIQDYSSNAQEVEEIIFEMETDFSFQEIFDAHKELAPFGNSFRSLKFCLEGEVETFIEDTRELIIDGYNFKTFIPKINIPESGQRVRITFKPGIDNKNIYYFKIDELEILE